MSKPILITGATGNQGGAVLDSLLKLNNPEFIIIALTRNADSPAAKRIVAKSASVRILQGNMDDPDQIFSEAQLMVDTPIWGVFMVQSVIANGVTALQEETQGKNFITSCITHRIQMLVYSSVDRGGFTRSNHNPTPVPVYASKHRIEQHLFQSTAHCSTTYFLLRPTGLIEPLIRNDLIGKIGRTCWKILVRPDRRIQWISCKDLAHFAVQGFLHPEEWSEKKLSLAGWEGTFAEADAVHRKVTGKDFALTFEFVARFIAKVLYKDLGVSFEWYNENGFGADIAYLKGIHPGLRSLEDCLKEQTGGAVE